MYETFWYYFIDFFQFADLLNLINQFDLIVLEPLKGALSYKLVVVDGKPITIGKIIVSLIFLIAGIYLSKIIIHLISNKIIVRLVESRAAAHAIENISFYFMVAFFSLMALQVANIPVTVFNIIGGAIALAAGLGSQNLMNNFISGLILLIERPVKIGDVIYAEDVYGKVEDIGMRSSKVLSFENKHLIIPNSKLLEGRVINWTHTSHKVRAEIKVGVAYGSDIEQVKKSLILAAKDCPATLKARAPIVIFENFGDDALEFNLYVEIRALNLFDERKTLSSIRENIVTQFDKENIVIAFPQRDIHVHLPEELKKILKKSA